jgi:hypothetical protein
MVINFPSKILEAATTRCSSLPCHGLAALSASLNLSIGSQDHIGWLAACSATNVSIIIFSHIHIQLSASVKSFGEL